MLPASINNINQIHLKYVPVRNETFMVRGEHSVTIEWNSDKGSIIGTFAISLHREFLLRNLIVVAQQIKLSWGLSFQVFFVSLSFQNIFLTWSSSLGSWRKSSNRMLRNKDSSWNAALISFSHHGCFCWLNDGSCS